MAQPKPSLGDLLGQTPKPSAEALRHHLGTARALAIYSNAELIGRLAERADVRISSRSACNMKFMKTRVKKTDA
jgi:hypothetical protein